MASRNAERPNIVSILTDDQGIWALRLLWANFLTLPSAALRMTDVGI